MALLPAFAHALSFSPQSHSPPRRRLRPSFSPTCAMAPPASFSNPLPQTSSDPFALLPTLTYLNDALPLSFRPDLLGTVLWSVGLYLGLSTSHRWGAYVRTALSNALRPLVSQTLADDVATATHTLPFLFAGLGVDGALRASGSGPWAGAAGALVAVYAGVYEAARASEASKARDSADTEWNAFQEFAKRRLRRRGRCHFVDVRTALRQDYRLRRLSDESLRRYLRTFAPTARRSPNGFYRELSVVSLAELQNQREEGTADNNFDVPE